VPYGDELQSLCADGNHGLAGNPAAIRLGDQEHTQRLKFVGRLHAVPFKGVYHCHRRDDGGTERGNFNIADNLRDELNATNIGKLRDVLCLVELSAVRINLR
jgi:hypothetical protein